MRGPAKRRCSTTYASSISSTAGSNAAQRPSVLNCYLCVRYKPLPMCPERTPVLMVGVTGFEPATSWTRTTRSTSLSYTPNVGRRLVLAGHCEPGQFDQTFFESGLWKGGQRSERLICLALSEARSVRKAPEACNGARDFRQIVQSPVLYGVTDHFTLGVIPMLHCINERESGFPLSQVVPEVLPELAFIGFIVERIIDQLEGGADMPAKARQGLFYNRGRVAQNRSDLRSGLEKPGRFALDDVEIARFGGIRIMRIHELQHFALGNGIGGVCDDLHDGHAVERHHHLKGPRIEEIAYQDAGCIAEHFIGSLAAAAQGGAVYHVVEQERRGMVELD